MADTNEASAAPADLTAKLESLKAQATQQYALKNYSAAAELYSEAAEVQDSINGEMSPENAELLYHYGRCLYHVAVQNSDVLGGKVASSEEPKRKKRKIVKSNEDNGEGSSGAATAGSSLIGDAIKSGEAASQGHQTSAEKASTEPSKPFFQITGDENWTDSEEEEDGDEADGEGAEGEDEGDDDDFAVAYEILDMARVLLARRIEAVRSASGTASEVRQLEERLADTHDLQAEISLENERFTDAINDTRDALALKLHLYPTESSLVAEAHFKLSLALEFASVTSTEPAADPNDAPTGVVDEKMRAEAAAEMEKAIESCTLRMEKESATLSSLAPEKATELRKNLVDIKEMIADMKQRLIDLRGPATSLSGLHQGPGGGDGLDGAGADAIRGVLGALLGESKSGQKKILEEATQNAHDLTGLVKKGKKKESATAPGQEAGATAAATYEGKGKRKAEPESAEEQTDATAAGRTKPNGSGKRVKFEEDPIAQ
jgi:HAT1-interacting factor 1